MISSPKQLDWNSIKRRIRNGEAAPDRARVADDQPLNQTIHRRQLDDVHGKTPAAANGETRRVLVFLLGEERYAVDLAALVKVFPLSQCTPVPGAPKEIVGVINVGGEICSVVHAAELLSLSPSGDRGEGQVILLRHANLQVGLRVDHVEAIATTTADSLSRPDRAGDEPSIRYVEGMTADSLIVLSLRQLMSHCVFQSDPVEKKEQNMTIGRKIAAGFWFALAVLIAVGFLSYVSMTSLIANGRAVTHTEQVLTQLEALLSTLKDAETGQRGFIITSKPEYLAPYTAGITEAGDILQNLRQLTLDNPNHQRSLDKIEPLIAAKFAELAETIELQKKSGFAAASAVVKDDRGKEYMDQIRKVVAGMRAGENDLLADRNASAEEGATRTLYAIGFGTLFAVVLVQLAGLWIARSISKPLRNVADVSKNIALGDLRSPGLPPASDYEVRQLSEAFNQMLVGLKDLAGQTISVTENLNAAASEILASTQQQAAGTKQQAATIQEITATMEEVRQSGGQIAERAKQVASAAEATSASSVSGLNAVEDTNRSMEDIRQQVEEVAENIVALSEKTQAIGEIIATVNDLAERSNLLALNAAIEAASAGEQGNRFSVVANEIKNLADQAKESTVQVRTILGEIQRGINSSVMLTEEAVKRVETGKQKADITEQTIRQMASTTQESVDAFQQIIGATGQQQIGMEQLTKGMQDIRQAATQTAASTVQLEKAMVSLTAQSRQLRGAVTKYQLA